MLPAARAMDKLGPSMSRGRSDGGGWPTTPAADPSHRRNQAAQRLASPRPAPIRSGSMNQPHCIGARVLWGGAPNRRQSNHASTGSKARPSLLGTALLTSVVFSVGKSCEDALIQIVLRSMRSLVSLCRVERPEVTELQLGSRAARLIRGKNENCNEVVFPIGWGHARRRGGANKVVRELS